MDLGFWFEGLWIESWTVCGHPNQLWICRSGDDKIFFLREMLVLCIWYRPCGHYGHGPVTVAVWWKLIIVSQHFLTVLITASDFGLLYLPNPI